MYCRTRALFRASVLVAMTAILAACGETRKVVWSPSGQHALVLAGDGLRVCDAEGGLSQPLIKDVWLVTWLGDERSITVVETAKATTWNEVAKLEPEAIKISIKDSAEKILKSARINKDSKKKFEDSLKGLPYLPEAALYLKDKKHREMTRLLKEQWTSVEKNLTVGIDRVVTYSLDLSNSAKTPGSNGSATGVGALKNSLSSPKVLNARLGAKKLLFETLRQVKEVRGNPQGDALLFMVKPEPFKAGTGYGLMVSRKDGKPIPICRGVSLFPDWSSDGRSVVYIQRDRIADIGASTPVKSENRLAEVNLGTVRIRKVISKTGAPTSSEKASDLAKVAFDNGSRVRSATKGSIIFSSKKIGMPCAAAEVPERQSLFMINPNQGSMVSPAVPGPTDRKLEDLAGQFEVSQERNYIAVPRKNGSVAVCEIATGKTIDSRVSNFLPCDKYMFSPQWRSDGQLCLPMKGQEAQVALWSIKDKSIKAISKNWPKSARSGLLE